MGLLKHLLFWPVTGPTFLARFSMEKVQDAVREELTDDQRIREDLLALQMELELGEIDDEEYVVREAELMRRLREVREWREEFGMGISGGPVQVARAGAPDIAPTDAPPGEEDRAPRGPVSPSDASVEINLDWDEERT